MSTLNKAIKYRLYPTKEQMVLFAKTFGCCRKVYNLMLSDKIESYKNTGSFGSQTPAMYKKEYPYLREVDSLALANVGLNLQQAMKNHFDKKRKKNTGFPKFKSKRKSRRSYTTNNQNETIYIAEAGIRLPKIGIVKAKIHRDPDLNWKLKAATVSQDSDGKYYVSILFEYSSIVAPMDANTVSDSRIIGLDYASNGLYVDSNGNVGTNHKYFKESEKKLAKAQRKLSKKKGSEKNEEKSNNYKKQQEQVNRIYRHVANQRKDNLHKISNEITNRYDIVCVESLDMKTMSNKKFGNGKATMDNGYGMFLNMLEYKLTDRGKHLVRVDKWFASSQICHSCGTVHPEMKDLSNRTMRCDCGLVMSRNQNAAINIKNEGLRMLNIA